MYIYNAMLFKILRKVFFLRERQNYYIIHMEHHKSLNIYNNLEKEE